MDDDLWNEDFFNDVPMEVGHGNNEDEIENLSPVDDALQNLSPIKDDNVKDTTLSIKRSSNQRMYPDTSDPLSKFIYYYYKN